MAPRLSLEQQSNEVVPRPTRQMHVDAGPASKDRFQMLGVDGKPAYGTSAPFLCFSTIDFGYFQHALAISRCSLEGLQIAQIVLHSGLETHLLSCGPILLDRTRGQENNNEEERCQDLKLPRRAQGEEHAVHGALTSGLIVHRLENNSC